jgi:hypothetical protein
MSPEWRTLCRAAGLKADQDGVDVDLHDGRHHRVSVTDADQVYELQAIVARPSHLRDVPEVPLLAWRRNRASQLMGFRLDRRGRLVGEAWVPKVGLTAEEFQLYVRHLAAECDRFEYLLTGSDTE